MSLYEPELVGPDTDPEIIRADAVVRMVGNEVLRAQRKFPAFNSPHEGYAVIKEELDELWEHCRANTGRSPEALTEAVQVAAMAVRYAAELCRRTTSDPTGVASQEVGSGEVLGR